MTKRKTRAAAPAATTQTRQPQSAAAQQAEDIAPVASPSVPRQPNLVQDTFESLGPNPTEDAKKRRDAALQERLKALADSYPTVKQYNVLILYDESQMVRGDADSIYIAIAALKEEKPLLLILYSSGGSIASAYLIGKLCRENANGKFVTVVPRQAKSAATLLCCAADEIHLGSMSELGPIDPQIDKLPALGLKNSVEHIAQLVTQYPGSSEMFSKYLASSMSLINLGYYERVAESAAQYAQRLLRTHAGALSNSPEKISQDLVYAYKDHGFVIDKSEAAEIFGDNVVKTQSQEYEFGNAVYQLLNWVWRLADMSNHSFYFIGSLDSKGVYWQRRK